MMLFKNIVNKNPISFDFELIKKALLMDPKDILKSVELCQLVGRGGAAYRVYDKWLSFINSVSDIKYLVINAHEGELGCEKDKTLIKYEIDKVLSGAVITAYTTGAKKIYIALKQADKECIEIVKNSILKYKDFGFEFIIHEGSEKYIGGEETALINDIEFGFPYPKARPPYPVKSGLFGCPTLLHNVETIANIPFVISNGPEWFGNNGTEHSRGTKLFTLSGDVNTPCVVEEVFGISFKKLIDKYAGGVKGSLYAVLPGFSPVIFSANCHSLTMDYESFRFLGTSLGTGNIVIFNSKGSLISYLKKVITFLADSSCLQCSNCRIISKIAKQYYSLQNIPLDIKNLSRCALMPSLIDMLNEYQNENKD